MCLAVSDGRGTLPVAPAWPGQSVSLLVSTAYASQETGRVVTDLLQSADEHVVATGYRPPGAAAGTTDLACQVTAQVITQQVVATAAGDTPVTIRKRLHETERWTSCAVTGVQCL